LKGKYGVKLELLEGWGEWGFINQETFCGKVIDLQCACDVFRNNASNKL